MTATSNAEEVNNKLIKVAEIPFIAERNIKAECPVGKSGLLRFSVHTEDINENVSIVGTKIEYAPHVEFGTVPHVILPKNAKALRFKGKGGKYVFAKRVNHPGTEPNPFFERGVERTIREVTGQ